jgi:hypothetical protein
VAAAQQTRPPRPGEEIVVKQTSSGEEVIGRFIALSPETLSLLVNGSRVDMPIDRVLRVDATRDSVIEGALIGAAILGGYCAFICGQGVSDTGELVKAVVVNIGVGAAIGAGFDAMHKGRVPLYVKPSGKAGAALQVRLRF